MSKLAVMRSKWSKSKIIRDRLGRFAAKNAPDLIVGTGGTVGSLIGGHFGGAVGALAGDLIGGLATRQVVNVTTSALNAKQKLIAKEAYKKAQRLQKLKMLGAETRSELKKTSEKLGDEITSDITGYVLGNAIANVTSKTLGKSIPFIGGTATYTIVPKLVKLRKQIASKHGNHQ